MDAWYHFTCIASITICSVFKRVGHQKNRVRTHPLREEICNSSKDCPWQKEKPDTPEEELNENESQVCFCNLRNLREENGPSQVQESTNNLCTLAETKLAGVLRAICKYRHSIHKISPKHRLRINQILQAVIRSATHIDHKLAKDLQDLYQDAAGDILVALWSHFPAEVLTKLLEAFTESDALKIDVWERKLVEFAERLLIDVTDKACFDELNQELRKVDQKCSTQSPERIFLYQYCGAILRASDDPQLIQVQLFTLLAMCQRGALEAKLCQRNTLLLCYGRVALGIKEEVLPRVEHIVAKLIEYFLIDPSDLNLKKSFLIAVLMLLEAITATGKAGAIRLHPKARLVLIEREPVHVLGSTVRQDAMYIAKELSHLKPLLEPQKKSSLLHASFKSVFCLAPMEVLEGQSCKDEKTSDIKASYQQTVDCFEDMLQALLLENPQPSELKHMMELIEPWMVSKLDHVRERAVETAMKLLKFVADRFHLDLSREFNKLAHLTALLIGLCNDRVECISSFAVQGVSCLYEILLHRKGLRTSKQKKRKWPMKRSHCGDQLFSVQLTNFLLSVLDYLRGSGPGVLVAAEEVLCAVLQNHAMKVERVRGASAAASVPSLGFSLLFKMQHLFLGCLESSPTGSTSSFSGDSLTQYFFYGCRSTMWLQASTCACNQAMLPAGPDQAMNVIYETFHIPGYRAALGEMHLQLFIPLLKQVLYVMQLELPEALKTRQDLILRENPTALTFQSTSVEIVKSLFSVAGDWAVYACIEFQQGWVVLSNPQHFLQGTRLLARAMTECNSAQIPGIFGEAALILSSEEDELKKVTALALVIEMMNRFSLREHLEEGLAAPNPAVQDLCLKGLNSFVFQQGKLPTMINSIFSGCEDVLEGLNDIMTTLYEMDGQGIGLISVDLALNVRSFFEDERADVRATAISLFGQLVMRSKETEKALLKKEVVYSLLPLLLHLKDRETTVAMAKLQVDSLALWSLPWLGPHEADMRNNHDNIHIFISQSLGFLHHAQTEIRNGAARFMGYTLNYYSSELSKNLEQEDLSHLSKVFQKMETSSDTSMVHFAKNYRVVLQKLSVKRRLAGAGEKDPHASDSNAPERSLLECDSRAPSPLLLPHDSPYPGRSTPERGILCLTTPKQARRTLAQRGKQHNEASERERMRSTEAPPGVFPSTSASTGGRQSPRH
ncbi:hypothetical protein E2320_007399 [Naja naja]|nr:hypothetical protein E2320_007399 [Naja naja]